MGLSDLNRIGARLKQLRELEGLTQAEFAKKVKLSQPAISQFEESKRMPSTKALQKIAAGLGMSIDEVIGEDVFDEDDDKENDKNAAIQSLVAKLNHEKVKKDEIIALNRYINARIGDEESSE